MNTFLFKRAMMIKGVVLVAIFLLGACGEVPLAAPEREQVAQPPATRRPTPTARATQGPVSPIATPTAVPSPTIEVIPTDISPERQFPAEKVRLTPANSRLANLSLPNQESLSDVVFNSWSNDGKQFAFLSNPERLIDPDPPEGKHNVYVASELWIANIDGSNPQKIADHVGISIWSPNNIQIFYSKIVGVQQQELWVINLGTDTSQKLTSPPNVDINNIHVYGNVAWFDNNNLLYPTYSRSDSQDRHIWLHNVKNGQIDEVLVDSSVGEEWRSLLLSPNKNFMVGRTENVLWLGRLVKEKDQMELKYVKTLVTDAVVLPYWAPDSSKLAIQSLGQFGNNIKIIDLGSDDVMDIPFPHTIAEVQWSPDSQTIVANIFAGGTSGFNPIYIANIDGSDLRQLADLPVGSIRWSPDGQHLGLLAPKDNIVNTPFGIINKIEVSP